MCQAPQGSFQKQEIQDTNRVNPEIPSGDIHGFRIDKGQEISLPSAERSN
jgi:hypothetical protein